MNSCSVSGGTRRSWMRLAEKAEAVLAVVVMVAALAAALVLAVLAKEA